jgi:DNA damage-binding protein 1
MNLEDELEETEIEGFSSQVQTLFCHDAVHNQLVQVGFDSSFLLWLFFVDSLTSV